jgi:predicted ABC-type ATPase
VDHRGREALLAARQGIAFETVFSTDDKLDFVARAKATGYFVRVFSSERQFVDLRVA